MVFFQKDPKVEGENKLGDFRPISFVGCLYKIVAKLLSNRLKKVLCRVVDRSQSAFLSGKSIPQSVLVTNEVVEEAKRVRKKCALCKVDFEKVYDSVS